MQALFDQLCEALFAGLEPDEQLSLSLHGETSHFTRFNAARIRQTGMVDDAALGLELIRDQRRAKSSISLTGDSDSDRLAAEAELRRLRDETRQLPEDPYIVLPASDQHSRALHHGNLLPAQTAHEALLPAMQDVDLAGLWASGRIYRGNANSLGSSHWFETDSFALDYSLISPAEKMVKATFAGSHWQQADYEKSIADAIDKLRMLEQPAISLKPGRYRSYIASAGVSDLLGMFSWNGLSELSMRTGESAFLRMRNEGVSLSPRFSLAEDFSQGMVPRFNDSAEVAQQRIELIRQGKLENCLASSRTASEYGLESNFADEQESLRSPLMAPGDLDETEVLQALDTGVYLSNLHYLNWSDPGHGRITGMTRYACFWVEHGEIRGPIDNMRFDDSFYRFFGDNLEAVGAQLHVNPDVGTYGGRELRFTRCPGILLSSFALTL